MYRVDERNQSAGELQSEALPLPTADDALICRQCRGRCCEGHPGVWTRPESFFRHYPEGECLLSEELRTILTEKNLVLRDAGGVLLPAPAKGEDGCIFLTQHGCSLTTQQRPDQCLALQPQLETLLDDDIHCTLPPEFGTGSARERWRAYWERRALW